MKTGKKDSINSTENVDDNAPETGAFIQWSCHPVKRRPLISLLVTIFVLLLITVIYHTTGSAGFGLLAFIIMFLSLAKFYFPTRYRLSDKGITVKTTTQTHQKQWSDFRSAYPDKNGVLLSPFAEPSRLENFRGMYIMFDNNKEEVTSFVNEHLGRECKELPGSEDR